MNRRSDRPFHAVFATLAVALAAFACVEPGKSRLASVDDGGGGGVTFANGLDAFTKALHGPVLRQKCAVCHADPTSGGAPLGTSHAAESASASYALVKGASYANFANPSNSPLAVKGGDNHCGGPCDAASRAAIVSGIQAWAPYETGAAASLGGANRSRPASSAAASSQVAAARPRSLTPIPLVPSLSATPGASQPVSWDLGEVDGALDGVQFQLEVQVAAGGGAYQVRRPTIVLPAGASFAVTVRDIRVAVNGQVDLNATTYSGIDRVVGAGSSGSDLSVGGASMLVAFDKGPGSDHLSVTFGELSRSAAECKELAAFSANVAPTLKGACIECHRSTYHPFQVLPGDLDSVLCARALQRADFAQPAQSPLIRYPKGGPLRRNGTAHPAVEGMGAATQAAFQTWIAAEAAAAGR